MRGGWEIMCAARLLFVFFRPPPCDAESLPLPQRDNWLTSHDMLWGTWVVQ